MSFHTADWPYLFAPEQTTVDLFLYPSPSGQRRSPPTRTFTDSSSPGRKWLALMCWIRALMELFPGTRLMHHEEQSARCSNKPRKQVDSCIRLRNLDARVLVQNRFPKAKCVVLEYTTKTENEEVLARSNPPPNNAVKARRGESDHMSRSALQ